MKPLQLINPDEKVARTIEDCREFSPTYEQVKRYITDPDNKSILYSHSFYRRCIKVFAMDRFDFDICWGERRIGKSSLFLNVMRILTGSWAYGVSHLVRTRRDLLRLRDLDEAKGWPRVWFGIVDDIGTVFRNTDPHTKEWSTLSAWFQTAGTSYAIMGGTVPHLMLPKKGIRQGYNIEIHAKDRGIANIWRYKQDVDWRRYESTYDKKIEFKHALKWGKIPEPFWTIYHKERKELEETLRSQISIYGDPHDVANRLVGWEKEIVLVVGQCFETSNGLYRTKSDLIEMSQRMFNRDLKRSLEWKLPRIRQKELVEYGSRPGPGGTEIQITELGKAVYSVLMEEETNISKVSGAVGSS